MDGQAPYACPAYKYTACLNDAFGTPYFSDSLDKTPMNVDHSASEEGDLVQVTPVSSPARPTKIVIPDLVSYCPFQLHINCHMDRAVADSRKWLFAYVDYNEKQQIAFDAFKFGELASACYPYAEFDQLRVCCDYMNFLFNLDDISDVMDNRAIIHLANDIMNGLYHPDSYNPMTSVGTMIQDYWKRFICTGSSGSQQRFMTAMDQYLHAVNMQSIDRKSGAILDLESYINIRRYSSGCKSCWTLIEYANDLDFPDEVMSDSIVQNLEECANDLVSWSNDILSYSREQGRNDPHNIVAVVMNCEGLDLQSALDFVGDMYKKSIDRFNENMDLLPSWGPEIDRQVQVYIGGLADWVVGSLHWSFNSERYFGTIGQEVKATRIIFVN